VADVVFTGEGKIDDQTLYGKTVIGVAEIAKKYDVPVYVLAGVDTLTTDDIYDKGVTAVFAIADRLLTLAESMECTEALIEKTMNKLCRTIITSQRMIKRIQFFTKRCIMEVAFQYIENEMSTIG